MSASQKGVSPVILKGKYELGRKLGAGGMGTVFLAQHLLLRQPVAVKVMNPGAMETPTAVERFLREARALAAVRHPGVCQVFDVDTDEHGVPFIVMEYLEGQTLDRLVQQHPATPLQERVRWIIEAAEGLSAVHARDIVHRDVKPSNLILAGPGQGTVKVVDFGVAKGLEDHAHNLTGDAAVGTLKFMSPEQLMGEQVDARADVWSLAVSLYQLVSGALPHDGETIGQYVKAVLSEPPRPLSRRGVTVPPALWRALDHALRPLAERTSDMQQFIAELRSSAMPGADEVTELAATERVLPPVSPPKRNLTLFVGLGALVLLISLATFGALSQPTPVPARRDPVPLAPVLVSPRPPRVVAEPEVTPPPAVVTPPPAVVAPPPAVVAPTPVPAPAPAAAAAAKVLPKPPKPKPSSAPSPLQNPDHL